MFKKGNKELLRNGEGYVDPTAYEAIKRDREETIETERFRKVLGCVLRILELSGFRLKEKIVLEDIKTGKIWK